jgi:hypothetical protein
MKRVFCGSGNLHRTAVARLRRSNFCGVSQAAELVLIVLSSFICASSLPALAEDDLDAYQQFVKYDNDSVSVAFSGLRASDAAQWVRATTGVAITLPTSTQSKTVNLRLEKTKVDQAVRFFLKALELNNTFLVYNRDGRLTDVVALEKTASQPASEARSTEEDKPKTDSLRLTSKERDALLRDFGRWTELTAEERDSVHARLRTIQPSEDRDQMVKEYLRQVLGLSDQQTAVKK